MYLERELEPLGDIRQWEGAFRHGEFKIYYRRYSRENPKNTLVALHGTTSHGGTFKNAIEPLMGVYDQIITPDIPGNGKSKAPEGARLEEYAEAIEALVEGMPGKVIYAHSGHAAIGVELYNRLTRRGEEPVLILAGPTYTPGQTFLGKLGGPIVELIGRLPRQINLPELVKGVYASFFAHRHEKALQQKRRIKMDNRALYWDVKAAEEYFRRRRPLVDDPSRVAILHFEQDPLSTLDREELERIHGGAWVIETGYRGHHMQKGAPEKLVEYHRMILERFTGSPTHQYLRHYQRARP